MLKQEFLDALEKKLSNLPKSNMEERLEFYREMIEDRIEEGFSEEEAVEAVGDMDFIALQIKHGLLTPQISDKSKNKSSTKTWTIVLLALGSPIWLSLAVSAVVVVLSLFISAFVVVISLVASLWAVVVSLWASFAIITVCAPVGVVLSIIQLVGGNIIAGLVFLSAGLVLGGLSIFVFYGSLWATKGAAQLTKMAWTVCKGLTCKGVELCLKLKRC